MTIYIHGIGEHPPKDQWKRQWDLALFGKPMGDQTSMAYWSDILHGPPVEGAEGAKAIRTRAIVSSAGDDDDDLDVDRILAGLKIPAKVKKAVAAKIASLSAEIANDNGPFGVDTRRGPSAKILPLPGFLLRM